MIASTDAGSTPLAPSYSYVLDDSRQSVAHPHRAGPTFVLKRGEPVSITVVNRLDEPTSVHWHGIELDSYYDGVAGFGGHPGRITPEIAPNDSFVVRFTPPRSGTFMYHPHVNEFRQQQAGLGGTLLVVDAPAARDSTTDIAWLITTPRLQSEDGTVYVNGTATPPAQELRAGVRYRIRLINLHNSRPGLNMKIVRESLPLMWRALAKDGMDVPPTRATMRPSVQLIANSETSDFEFTAPEAGDLRFDITSNNPVGLSAGSGRLVRVIHGPEPSAQWMRVSGLMLPSPCGTMGRTGSSCADIRGMHHLCCAARTPRSTGYRSPEAGSTA